MSKISQAHKVDGYKLDHISQYVKGTELVYSNMTPRSVRNSLLLAPMPTASTSQILGNNEAFEPYTSNLYTRRVLSGEFIIVNKHLLQDLVQLGIWNEDLKQYFQPQRACLDLIYRDSFSFHQLSLSGSS